MNQRVLFRNVHVINLHCLKSWLLNFVDFAGRLSPILAIKTYSKQVQVSQIKYPRR